jgi:hypothetical protein
MLCIFSVAQPTYKRTDLKLYEGDYIPLYVRTVDEKLDTNRYCVIAKFTGEKHIVVCDAQLQTDDIISFYGLVKNDVLFVSKYHIHEFPDLAYYISFIGLIMLIVIVFKLFKLYLKTSKNKFSH